MDYMFCGTDASLGCQALVPPAAVKLHSASPTNNRCHDSQVTPCLRFTRPPSFCRLMPARRSLRPRRNSGCLNSCHESDSCAAAAPGGGSTEEADLMREAGSPLTFLKPGARGKNTRGERREGNKFRGFASNNE